MKSFLFIFLFIFVACTSSQKKDYKPAEARKISYESFHMDNGLEVLVLPDNSLPYFSMSMLIYGGALLDGHNQSGITQVTADLLDQGADKWGSSEIADQFARIGSDFESATTADYISFSASTLSQYREKMIDLFSTVIQRPNFKSEDIHRIINQKVSILQKMVDEPEKLASHSFMQMLYGSHKYAFSSMGRVSDLSQISREDILLHYKKYFAPNRAVLAVVGQVPENLQELLKQHFSQWKSSSEGPIPVLSPPIKEGAKFVVVDKPGLVQTQIRIGQLGITRKNPDFIALRVAATILGSGFSSRLMDEVRDNRGLTYGIDAGFDARIYQGPFEISTFTRNEKVSETIEVTQKVVEQFVEKGATQKELDLAKGFLLGNFPRAIETPEKLAANLLLLRVYNVPDTYLSTYIKEVEKISLADVNRVVKKYIQPKDLQILVFTDASQIKPQLEKFAHVQIMSYQDVK